MLSVWVYRGHTTCDVAGRITECPAKEDITPLHGHMIADSFDGLAQLPRVFDLAKVIG